MTYLVLKIILPTSVHYVENNISQIKVETIDGLYGIKPKRLDFCSILKEGILTIQGISLSYMILGQGVITKINNEITISTRFASPLSKSLEELKENLKQHIYHLSNEEKKINTLLRKYEISLGHYVHEYRKNV